MIESVRCVDFGRAASEALAEEVLAAKAGDPLAPVTVIVPSNVAGLSARRLLAGATLTHTGGANATRGVVNVWFTTLYALAARLADPEVALGDRKPLTNPVLRAAIRGELRAVPGYFSVVAGHYATEAAVAGLFAELSRAHPDTLTRIAAQGSSRAGAVVELYERVRRRLHGFYDEDALVEDATAALATAHCEVPGAVVWFLPREVSPAMAEMLRALASRTSMRVVVGLTHEPLADSATQRACEAAGVEVPASSGAAPTASRIVSVSDADEEVRAVAGEIVQRAERGTPLDRMGVFYPLPEPYERLVPEHLGAAGIPHNGPGPRRVAELVAGRTLLAAIELGANDYERQAVIALVDSAPVRHGARLVPASHWDLVSRRAGVIGGAADWSAKLTMHHEMLERRLADREEGGSQGAIDATRRELADTAELAGFVASLVDLVSRGVAASSWHELARWAALLMVDLLGPDATRGWPPVEVAAAEAVHTALARLSLLDEVDARPTLDGFATALAAELDVPAARTGRFGEGVVFGPLESAYGLDLDAVWVLGMAEGTCPAPRREDSLLADEERRLAVRGELPLRRARVHQEHRLLLAALGAGARERVMLYPRGDHRNGRARIPSRWMLRSAGSLSGAQVFSSDFERVRHPAIHTIGSYLESVTGTELPAAPRDVRVRELLAQEAASNDVTDHYFVSGSDLGAGLAAARARSSGAFTRFDGNLGGTDLTSPAAAVLSATRVETWAQCPFRFFLANLLHLGRVERPERALDIDPRERGTIVHRILERFVREPLEHGGLPGPDDAWSPQQVARLREIAAAELDEAERRGVTGKRLLWDLQKRRIRAQLEHFVVADAHFRAEHRGRPERVEMAFGLDGAEPAVVELPTGEVLRFRGRADRVDRSEDGGAVVVDYKSGSADYAPDLESDPVAAGSRLQLPIYAVAARQQLGAARASAYYWYTGSLTDQPHVGYELTDERETRFGEVLTTIVEGIVGGAFPANPGEYDWFRQTNSNCFGCDFDELCPRDRLEQFEAKCEAGEMAGFVELAFGEPGEADL